MSQKINTAEQLRELIKNHILDFHPSTPPSEEELFNALKSRLNNPIRCWVEEDGEIFFGLFDEECSAMPITLRELYDLCSDPFYDSALQLYKEDDSDG